MLESVMFWNEINNRAHWHGGEEENAAEWVEDPGWKIGLPMVRDAATAARERFPHVERVFSGLSPMDPAFLERAADLEALEPFDAVAGHNFWVDFGPTSVHGESGLDDLEARVERMRALTERRVGRALPVILSEIGVSSFGGDELQAWATEKTLRALERLVDRWPDTRATWYSLFDLPEEYLVTTLYRPDSHGEVRHRKFGLYRFMDGDFRPKAAARTFAHRRHPDRIGITQWFRIPWPDPARGLTAEMAREMSYRVLEAAPPRLRELDAEWLRINVTWCDWHCVREGEIEDGFLWFDDLLDALSEFRLLVSVFQTPPQLCQRPERYVAGSVPHPEAAGGFREMVLEMLQRYAPEDDSA